MNYEVELTHVARAYLRGMDNTAQRRIGQRLDQIAADPRGRHGKSLAGPGDLRSARVGTWRIIFEINDERQVVTVTNIGPRGQVYRGL